MIFLMNLQIVSLGTNAVNVFIDVTGSLRLFLTKYLPNMQTWMNIVLSNKNGFLWQKQLIQLVSQIVHKYFSSRRPWYVLPISAQTVKKVCIFRYQDNITYYFILSRMGLEKLRLFTVSAWWWRKPWLLLQLRAAAPEVLPTIAFAP